MSNKENKYIIRMTKRFKKHLKRMEKRNKASIKKIADAVNLLQKGEKSPLR